MKRICFILLAVIALCSCAKSADKERIRNDVEALREDRIATLQMQKQSIAEGLEILSRIDADAAGKLSDFLADNFVKGADWKDATLATLEAHDSTLSALYALNLSPASVYLLETFLENADAWVNYRFSAVSQLLAARGRLDKMEIPSSYPAVLAKKAVVRAGLNDAITTVSEYYAAIVSDAIDLERGELTEELLQRIVTARELAATAIWDSDTFIESFSSLPAAGVALTRQATALRYSSACLNAVLNVDESSYSSIQFGFSYGLAGRTDNWMTRWVQTKDDWGWYKLDISNLEAGTEYAFKSIVQVDGLLFEGETLTFTTLSPQLDSVGAVDLGLSVKWASGNLTASGLDSPTGLGDCFAWGETSPKYNYKSETYVFGWLPEKYNGTDSLRILKPEDDAAHMILGGNWRMPTSIEFGELIRNCTLEFTEIGNQKGELFTSKINGESIFLPAAEKIVNNHIRNSHQDMGYYWTSGVSYHLSQSIYGVSYSFGRDIADRAVEYRYCGLSIRPVTD